MTTSATTATQRLQEERQRLERIRDGLRHEGFGTRSSNGAVSDIEAAGQHQADVATETFETEAGTTILGDVEEEIVEVDRALTRVADGTYGYCAVCTEPIPDARLSAVPATRFCVQHEERWEVGGGFSADAMTNARDLDGGFLAHDNDDASEFTRPTDQSPEAAAVHVDGGPGWTSEDNDPSEDDRDSGTDSDTEER